jgi:hypothetical protein
MTKHADTPRKIATFRIDQELLDGMELVWERDGVAVSEQVRRAIRAWLEGKGIRLEKAQGKRVSPRKPR